MANKYRVEAVQTASRPGYPAGTVVGVYTHEYEAADEQAALEYVAEAMDFASVAEMAADLVKGPGKCVLRAVQIA